jgi:hypothetical protein
MWYCYGKRLQLASSCLKKARIVKMCDKTLDLRVNSRQGRERMAQRRVEK